MAIAALYVERPPLTAAARLDIVGEDAVFCTPYHQPETALHQAVGAGVDRIVDVDLLSTSDINLASFVVRGVTASPRRTVIDRQRPIQTINRSGS